MKKQHIVVLILVAVGIALIALALRTRPTIETPSPTNAEAPTGLPGDPLRVPMLLHMMDAERLEVGQLPEADLEIEPEGDRVRVVFSQAFLDDLGPNTLTRIGLFDNEATLSWSGYLKMLNDLHEVIIEKYPHAHEGDGEHHDHHDHHEHDEHHEYDMHEGGQ